MPTITVKFMIALFILVRVESWFAQVIISLLLLTVTSDLLDVNDHLVDSVAAVVIDVIFYLQCQVCFERCKFFTTKFTCNFNIIFCY